MSRAPSPDPHGPSAFECSSAGVRAGAARGCPAAARRALRRTARIPAAGARRRRAQTLHRVSDAPGRARAGMWVPGLTGLVVGAGLLLLVRDSPEAVGYPPVETVQAKPKQADGASAPKESLMSLLLNNVLKNPFIWGMAFTYFFVYVVRQGVTSWFVFYLIKARAPARVRRAGRVPWPGGQGGAAMSVVSAREPLLQCVASWLWSSRRDEARRLTGEPSPCAALLRSSPAAPPLRAWRDRRPPSRGTSS